MYRIFRRIFFMFSAEKAHGFVLGIMRAVYCIPPLRALVRSFFCIRHPSLEREFCGLKFANPVGLAAGFDKNAKYYKAFSMLGFSFIEIGTVTPEAQPGNPQPRLFRLVRDKALINRMGLNNDGVEAVVNRLKSRRPKILIGGNIGKNTQTANADAPADYLTCFRQLYPYVDYFTVNVSCPNVSGWSALQTADSLREILSALMKERNRQEQRKPVLLKISPDLSFLHLEAVLEITDKIKVDGIVAVNTTTRRAGLAVEQERIESVGEGGMSGKPLIWKALETINYIRQRTKGKLPIIGVGGIMSAEDAIHHINAGATLVEVYSGLVYEGPSLVKKINKAILRQGKQ